MALQVSKKFRFLSLIFYAKISIHLSQCGTSPFFFFPPLLFHKWNLPVWIKRVLVSHCLPAPEKSTTGSDNSAWKGRTEYWLESEWYTKEDIFFKSTHGNVNWDALTVSSFWILVSHSNYSQPIDCCRRDNQLQISFFFFLSPPKRRTLYK